MDNAGVYKLRDDLAIIQTVDFFTPIVDDPYIFGKIAVANSLSDVYTMGGKPITALNLVSFPSKKLDISVLREILRGGAEKMEEAGVILMGGHSIEDPELKYGLSVTGIVHPDRMITNGGSRPDDRLILTKPLGTGIINTAIKSGDTTQSTVDKISRQMATLNKVASEVMQEVGVNSCTDITGFGFLGHIAQMAKNSGVCLRIYSDKVPHYPEAVKFAKVGLCPAGLYRNREFYSRDVKFADSVPDYMHDILFDPQTSGGLFMSVPKVKADTLLKYLRDSGVEEAAIVGDVVKTPEGTVSVV
jgi:selenide, water dikinase